MSDFFETAKERAVTVVVSLLVGGMLATGWDTLVDGTHSRAIAENTRALSENAGADSIFRQEIRTELAVLSDRVIRLQQDMTEVKELVRNR